LVSFRIRHVDMRNPIALGHSTTPSIAGTVAVICASRGD
jgi:hypothetical protein